MDDEEELTPVTPTPIPRSRGRAIVRDPDGQMWIHEDGEVTVHVKPSSSYLVEGSWLREVRWDDHAGHWVIVD